MSADLYSLGMEVDVAPAIRELERLKAGLQSTGAAATVGAAQQDEAAKKAAAAAKKIADAHKKVGDSSRVSAQQQREAAKGVSSEMQKLEGVMGRVKSAAGQVAGALGVAWGTAAILSYVKAASLAAGETERMGIASDVIGKNFGRTAAEIAKAREELTAAGLTIQESQQGVMGLVRANVDLAKATELANAAQNLAVVGGMEAGAAMDMLNRAVQTGQTRILMRLGISVDLQSALAKEAAANNTVVGALSKRQIAEARTNALLDATRKISGTYAATVGTVSHALSEMGDETSDLKQKLGNTFNTAFKNQILGTYHALQSLNEGFDKTDGTMALVKATASDLLKIVGLGAAGWLYYTVAMMGVADVSALVSAKIVAFGGPWIALAAAVTAVIVAMNKYEQLAGTVAEEKADTTDYVAYGKALAAIKARRKAAAGPTTGDDSDDAGVDNSAAKALEELGKRYTKLRTDLALTEAATKQVSAAFAEGGERAEMLAREEVDLDAKVRSATEGMNDMQRAIVGMTMRREMLEARVARNARALLDEKRAGVERLAQLKFEQTLVGKTAEQVSAMTLARQRELALLDAAKAATPELTAAMVANAEAVHATSTETNRLVSEHESLVESVNGAVAAAQKFAAEWKASNEKAAADAERPMLQAIENIQRAWGEAFDKILQGGQGAWENFASGVSGIMRRLVAEMISLKMTEKLTPTLQGMFGLGVSKQVSFHDTANASMGGSGGFAKLAGAGLAGVGVGYGIGSSTTKRENGALFGMAGGAAAGFAVGGPVGAAVGALTGLVGGLVGSSQAARAHAKALEEAQRSLRTTMDQYTKTAFGTNTDLDQQLAAAKAEYDALQKQIGEAYSGRNNETARFGARKEADVAYAANVERIQRDAAKSVAQQMADLEVRRMRASGQGPQAEFQSFVNGQDRERQGVVDKYGDSELGKQLLAALSTAQAAERDQFNANRAETERRTIQDLATRGARATAGMPGGVSARDLEDLERQIAMERELADARKAGLSPEILAGLEAAGAKEKAAAEFRRKQQDDDAQADYRVRLLRATGQGEAADALQRQLAMERELRAAQVAGLDAATLAALGLAQAAEAAASAADAAMAKQQALEDLEVRAKRATGDTAGADDLAFQLQQQREREQATKDGMSADYLAQLQKVQEAEAQQRRGSGAYDIGPAYAGAVTRAEDSSNSRAVSVGRISEGQAEAITSILSVQTGLLVRIAMAAEAMAGGAAVGTSNGLAVTNPDFVLGAARTFRRIGLGLPRS